MWREQGGAGRGVIIASEDGALRAVAFGVEKLRAGRVRGIEGLAPDLGVVGRAHRRLIVVEALSGSPAPAATASAMRSALSELSMSVACCCRPAAARTALSAEAGCWLTCVLWECE